MKRTILILLFLLVSIIQKADNNSHIYIDSVYIVQKVCWDCITDPPVSCIDKDSNFIINGYRLTNKQDIKILIEMFDSLKISNNKYIDTKFKMYFYISDTIKITACIDQYHTLTQGNIYKTSSDIIHFIDSIINNFDETPLRIRHNKYENKIISGKEELRALLKYTRNNIAKNKILHDNLFIKIVCSIYKNGNTVRAKIYCDKEIIKILPRSFIKRIETLFIKKIKWIPNNERQYSDIQLLKLQI